MEADSVARRMLCHCRLFQYAKYARHLIPASLSATRQAGRMFELLRPKDVRL